MENSGSTLHLRTTTISIKVYLLCFSCMAATLFGGFASGEDIPLEKQHLNFRQDLFNVEERLGWSLLTSGFEMYLCKLKTKECVAIPNVPGGSEASLSPDISRIAFWISEDMSIEEQAARLSRQRGNANLYVVSIDGMQKAKLLEAHWPSGLSWSHDGKKLAFVGGMTPEEYRVIREGVPSVQTVPLYIVDLEQKTSIRVLDACRIDFRSKFLNPGDQWWGLNDVELVYRNFEGSICVYDISSKTSKVLDEGDLPAWSPKGDLIAYQGGDGNFYLIRPEGTEKRLLLKNVDHLFFGPLLWSPDGRFILVQAYAYPTLWDWSESADVYVIEIETGRRLKVISRDGRGWMSWKGRNE